ncbi:hypothetical protein ABID21_003721 [Pseudorhizobium tarimense]|uniref:Flagellar protein n=1 Tax=Pseudorhizobium tarimense TaxID=1079109 RepID=A0ABV2HAQ0_9HYPH|nr:flagellar protein [Pseudorhizobium tarimense]MCJ8520863.1 flagellar protein [Pseudorhizobium tarimense]
MLQQSADRRNDLHTNSKETGRLGDRVLTASGIILAAASAFFPWYVFLNQDKFGIKTESFGHTRDLPPLPGRNVMGVSPLAMTDNSEDEETPAPLEKTDNLTTATVSSLGKEKSGSNALPDQPFPGKSSFRLLHVANGRALIEDGAGMYMVRIGSILPDNSKLATIEQREGKWVIVTTAGEVYDEGSAARP